MFEFLKILKIILFKNEIIFINSPLQFLNYIEYENKFFLKKKIFKKKYILFGFSYYEKEYETAKYLLKLLKIKNISILKLQNNIPKLLFITIIKLRGKMFNYKFLIIGDYNSFLSKELYKYSREVVMVDDGTNSLNFQKLFNLDKKKLTIFSMFEKSVFNHNKFIKNRFIYLKSFLKKQILKDHIIILGSADVEKKLVKFEKYLKILKEIKNEYKKKILYFPHPKESYTNYSKYGFRILKTNKTIESYLLFEKFLPKKIIGFNSSAFISINSIYDKRINLENYSVDLNLAENKNLISIRNFYNEIESYFQKKIGVKTKNKILI